MPIPTQGLTEKMQLTSDTSKLNAQRAAIHAEQAKVAEDISEAQARTLTAMLADPAPPPIDPDSVAAKTGGAPDEVIKIIEHGGLRVQATKDMITVLDLYNGTDQAFLHDGKSKEPERVIPPLSAKTLAEMEAGRKRLAEYNGTYRPPPVEDKTVGQTNELPGDFVDGTKTFRSNAQTPTKVTMSRG